MEEAFDLLGTPKYLTIALDLRNKIQKGIYSSGTFLPPEKELGEIYRVSRPTIRSAIAKLREMGMLEVIHGTGTRVVSRQIYQQLANQLSFTDVIEAQGLKPGTIVKEAKLINATPEIADKLCVSPGESVFKIGRLRTADNQIISYHLSYLRKEFPVDKDRLEQVLSLYRYINEEYGLSILFTDDTIWAEPATPDVARILKVKLGEAVLMLDRMSYGPENQVIELSNSFIRCDRLKYKVRTYRKGKI